MRHVILLLLCAVLAPATFAHPIDADKQVQPVAQQERAGRVPDRCLPAGFPQVWDKTIRRAWLKHGKAEWAPRVCGFRAQICLESSCGARGEDVRSHKDAVGPGQLLKTAAADCKGAGLIGKRVDVKFNLMCSAWVMKRNGRIFSSNRTEECRIPIARGCYVTGCGHLIRAQKLARADGHSAVCLDDGMLEYTKKVLSPSSYKALVHYVETIAKYEEEMTP